MSAQHEDRDARSSGPRIVHPGGAKSEDGRRRGTDPRVERVFAWFARRQHGVVSRAQLLAAGVSRREIAHRLEAGSLIPLYRGVYAVGHTAITDLGRVMAAVLASGPGAAASFLTAAVLWDLLPRHEGPIHVSRAGPRRDGRNGIVIHEATDLDTTHRHGIPITTPARTILDLAATATDRDLARALTEVRIRRLVTDTDLLTRAVHRPGAKRLQQLLEHDAAFTRSELERKLLGLLDRARLPRPRTNVHLHGYEVDAYWPEHGLVVEVDGFAYHGHRDAFERDRAKDATLTTNGYRVIRLTWRRLTREPEATAATLARALVS